MSSKEILTLQFGHYSNFVGTHWWNIQESGFTYDPDAPSEINHDVLFREGLTLKGEVTFTPRALLVDLKGSLKTLSEHGELYNSPPETDDLDAEVIPIEEKEEKNNLQKDLVHGTVQTKKIYDLDNEVRVWSDFLYTRFHPRTVNVIRQYQHSSENTPFDIYPLGLELWKTQQFAEDFTDKIRNYVEECDNFQGFHTLNDSNDAFSGLTVSCLEYLRDEYSTKTILSFPLDPNPLSKNHVRLLNTALLYDSLGETCSLFVPLSTQTKEFNRLTHKPDLLYHSSAILASALDTITLNYRLKASTHSVIDLSTDLSANGRKAAAAGLSLPFPMKASEDFIDCLNNWDGPLFQTVTPNCEISTDENLHLMVLRGIPEDRLKRPLHQASHQRDYPAYRCTSLREMLSYYMACTSYGSRAEVTVAREEMPVKVPFPRIFDGSVGKTGDIDAGSEESVGVESVKVLAGLHSGKFVGDMFDNLSKDLEKIKYKRFYQFSNEGVENDQFKECFEHILDLRDCYEDHYLI